MYTIFLITVYVYTCIVSKSSDVCKFIYMYNVL
jgi:hypothetical protein